MHLLRTLLLAAAHHSFSFSAQHIPGAVGEFILGTKVGLKYAGDLLGV